jgi:hypothetical protein
LKLLRVLAGSVPQEVGSADSFLPLVAAALLMTGTFRLALAAGGQGTEQAAAVERNGVFGRSIGLSQAAVELQVSFALLL